MVNVLKMGVTLGRCTKSGRDFRAKHQKWALLWGNASKVGVTLGQNDQHLIGNFDNRRVFRMLKPKWA